MARPHLSAELRSLLLVCAAILSPAAQDPSRGGLSEFEVSPIDPNVPHRVGARVYPGGRVVLSGMTLRALISVAYRTASWQISGAEAWLDKDAYDVEAKPSEAARSAIKTLRYTVFAIEDERLREMVQALLAQRFQLKLHRETRTGDVYALVRSGRALALRPIENVSAAKPSEDLESFGSIGYAGGTWVISASSMAQLAKFAGDNILHAPVADRTELSGWFDYKQRVPDDAPNYSDPSESFLRLIPEIGLKLERSKGPVEILVIDRAAKPSEN